MEDKQRETSWLSACSTEGSAKKVRWIGAPGSHAVKALPAAGHRVEKLATNRTLLQEGLKALLLPSAFGIIKVKTKAPSINLTDRHTALPSWRADLSNYTVYTRKSIVFSQLLLSVWHAFWPNNTLLPKLLWYAAKSVSNVLKTSKMFWLFCICHMSFL